MSAKRVFVSDVHMSPGLSFGSQQGSYDWFSDAQALQFKDFLQELIGDNTVQEVILLGDLMDGWVYPIEVQPPKYDKIANAAHIIGIMTNLRELAKRKQVIYIVGNHDMTLMEAQFDNFRSIALAGIKFQDVYETRDGLYAEHGHQYTMYNAVDPNHELPIGHYISRLAATVAERKQHFYINADFDMRFPSTGQYNVDAKGFIADPLVNAPLSYLEVELGNVDDSTPITTVGSGVITLAEVRRQYGKVGIDWIRKHGLLGGVRSVWREAVGLEGVADQIATGHVVRGKNYKVVIFGHTHKKENQKLGLINPVVSPGPQEPPYAIYANCGAWCQNNEPTYVVDEYDDGRGIHKVTLKFWGKPDRDVINEI